MGGDDLRAIWADAKVLVARMRNLKRSRISIPDPRGTIPIVYSPVLLQRMRAMACAAIGRLAAPDCAAIHAAESLDPDLRQFASHAAAERDRTGEDNYVLRRAALLHADVEIIKRPELSATAPSSGRALPGPQLVRADSLDGVSLNVRGGHPLGNRAHAPR